MDYPQRFKGGASLSEIAAHVDLAPMDAEAILDRLQTGTQSLRQPPWQLEKKTPSGIVLTLRIVKRKPYLHKIERNGAVYLLYSSVKALSRVW